MSAQPIRGLDHLVVNVQERMDEIKTAYERLGFALTTRGQHSVGTINHLIMLQDNYLELLGAPAGAMIQGFTELLAEPPGPVACALATDDAGAAYEHFHAAGIEAIEPQELSRPVDMEGEMKDASFRITKLSPNLTKGTMFFFCEHRTRELIWRPEWQRHANGAEQITALFVVAAEPAAILDPYRRLFGAANVTEDAHGATVQIGTLPLYISTAARLAERWGDGVLRPDAPTDYIAGCAIRVRAREDTAALLEQAGADVRRRDSGLVIPAEVTRGTVIEFV